MTQIVTNNDAARLQLWERMARAIMRAYVKLPDSKHNVALNKELRELIDILRGLEPSLKDFYPLD